VGDVLSLADQIANQLLPTVNMLHASRRPGASLQTILEENLDSESLGSTETLAETFTEQPPLPPFQGGTIFNVSIDSPLRTAKPMRNAPLARTRMSIARSAEQMSTPFDA